MKFTEPTLKMLKSFSQINDSILFKPGNELSTVALNRTIIAKATVDMSFDRQFAVYELSKLLGALSMFSDPDVAMSDTFMTISEGKNTVRYMFAKPDTIITPPAVELKTNPIKASFSFPATALAQLQKAAAVLRVPEIAFVGEAGKIRIKALNGANQSSDTFSVDIGDTEATFIASVKAENFKIIPGDYIVQVGYADGAKTPTPLLTMNGPVRYWIAVEASRSKV